MEAKRRGWAPVLTPLKGLIVRCLGLAIWQSLMTLANVFLWSGCRSDWRGGEVDIDCVDMCFKKIGCNRSGKGQ